jgi:hypothetical protein
MEPIPSGARKQRPGKQTRSHAYFEQKDDVSGPGGRRSQKTCFLHTCSSVRAGRSQKFAGSKAVSDRKQLCFTFATI